MQKLMKYTYLLYAKKVKEELDKLWNRYQEILNNPNWEDLNEARAILYLTGQIYCEQIAVGAIERRMSHLREPLTLIEFFVIVDSNSKELNEYRKDEEFKKLEEFYNVIKEFKNKHIEGEYYIDEQRFIELYNKFAPDELAKTSYKGIIKLKKKN